MTRIEEARVRQKAQSLQDWMDSDLDSLDGEQLFVRSDVDDTVIGFKFGAKNKKFRDLPYPDLTVRGKCSTSTSWIGRQSGVYIPILSGNYNGINVSLADGYQVLYWDGITLEKVVYPIDYTGLVFGGVIDDTKDLSTPTIPIWYIAKSGEYNTIPPISLGVDSILTWDGNQWSHIPFNLEVRGEFLIADNVQELRSIPPQVLQLLVNGTYKGVTLLGYYEKGDTPSPIEYYISTTSDVDDGGSVFVVGGLKLVHDFGLSVDILYFGATTSSLDNKNFIDKAITYLTSKLPNRDHRATLLIPSDKGTFITSGGHIVPRYIDVKMLSEVKIKINALGVIGFKIGESGTFVNQGSQHIINIVGEYRQGLDTPVQPTYNSYIGVELYNEYYCKNDIRSVRGFQKGARIIGSRFGNSYNKYFIGVMEDCNVLLELYSTKNGTSDVGWCNENIFYGGSLRNNSSFRGSQVGVLFDSDSGYDANSNKFEGTSLEGFEFNKYAGNGDHFVRAIHLKCAKETSFSKIRYENGLDNAPVSHIGYEEGTSNRNIINGLYIGQNVTIENRSRDSYIVTSWKERRDIYKQLNFPMPLVDYIGLNNGIYVASGYLNFCLRGSGNLDYRPNTSSVVTINDDSINSTFDGLSYDIDVSKDTTKRDLLFILNNKSTYTNSRFFVKMYKSSGVEYTETEYNNSFRQHGGAYQTIFGGCVGIQVNQTEYHINVPSGVDIVRVIVTGDAIINFSVLSISTNLFLVNSLSKNTLMFDSGRVSKKELISSSSVIDVKNSIYIIPSTVVTPFALSLPLQSNMIGKEFEFINKSNVSITLNGPVETLELYVIKPLETVSLIAGTTSWQITKTISKASTTTNGTVKQAVSLALGATSDQIITALKNAGIMAT